MRSRTQSRRPIQAPRPLKSGANNQDAFGRRVSYLRLSLTDRCNLRCTYCLPLDARFTPRADVLSASDLLRISDAFIRRGTRKIRLTGGEPLLRPDIADIVRGLGRRLGDDLEELTLTTNATRLAIHADMLAEAGMRRINVSLDTLDPERFKRIARFGSLDRVLQGLNAARSAGLRVRINTVLMKGGNEAEIPDLVAWAHSHGHDIALIEIMPMTGDADRSSYRPMTALQTALQARFQLRHETRTDAHPGPARFARSEVTGHRVGFISALTDNFCADCNRMRVTATGRIYMCLGQDDHVDLREALAAPYPEDALDAAIGRALSGKPERHNFDKVGRARPERFMSVTGG
ncbi:MAG: GTP 3',8-cyclase MoaA [Pseudomonadota bacterium]